MQDKSISQNNFEQCLKCAVCTTVCPVMANNPSYPGPKIAGPDMERYRLKDPRFFDDALKLCLNCKRCEVACPSDVHIADIIQSSKIHYGKRHIKLRDRMLASTDLMGPVATAFAPLVNASLSFAPVKAIVDGVIGVSRHRTMPEYSDKTFESWFRRNAQASQDSFHKHISYFHGCYANYNYPQLGRDFVAVMNALGYGVHLLEGEKCCGTAKLTNSMAESARKDAVHNLAIFRKSIKEQGRPVITVSTSCTMTILEEYPNILGLDNSDIKDSIQLFERFIYDEVSSGRVKLVFRPEYNASIAYHEPCHQARLGLSYFTVELLRMIPGASLNVLPSSCCGIAGTYGFKKENYELSQAIGEPLFSSIRDRDPDFVACECETCKWQIEMSTGYKVKNPVSILAEALDLYATFQANR